MKEKMTFAAGMLPCQTKLEFNRSLVPRNRDRSAKPNLVIFSDGSDKGQCAVAYLVWKMENCNENAVGLVTSRTKIASMQKITKPGVLLLHV